MRIKTEIISGLCLGVVLDNDKRSLDIHIAILFVVVTVVIKKKK